jgi:hypothetical protein
MEVKSSARQRNNGCVRSCSRHRLWQTKLSNKYFFRHTTPVSAPKGAVSSSSLRRHHHGLESNVWAARDVADWAAVYFNPAVAGAALVEVVERAAGAAGACVTAASCVAAAALGPAQRPVCHPEQRWFSGTPRRALSLWAPQPPHVARPH